MHDGFCGCWLVFCSKGGLVSTLSDIKLCPCSYAAGEAFESSVKRGGLVS